MDTNSERRLLMSKRKASDFGSATVDLYHGPIDDIERVGMADRYDFLAKLILKKEREMRRIARLEALIRENWKASGKKGDDFIGFESTHDEWWVDYLAKNPEWKVTKDLLGVPGAYSLSYSKSFACLLVLKNVCHFNYHRRTGGQGGFWYSENGHDISVLLEAPNICGLQPKTTYPSREMSAVTQRQGRFLGREEAASLSISLLPNGTKKEHPPVWRGRQALAAPHDAFPGHFIETVGPLAELSASLALGLNLSSGEPIFSNLTVNFGANDYAMTYARGVLQILFGETVRVMGGKKRADNAHICFEEVLFPLNNRFSKGYGPERFKNNAYKTVTKKYFGGGEPPLWEPNYQVTWLWRSSSRTIINEGEVLRALEGHFGGLPLNMLEFHDNQPMVEVIDIMRRSAFVFGMHGAGFSNEMFLPTGSLALELLPFKMIYAPYKSIGHLFGVKWEQWKNEHFESTVFDNGCFKEEWHKLSALQCKSFMACYQCVKNYSRTKVNIPELQKLLRILAPEVRKWIKDQKEKSNRN